MASIPLPAGGWSTAGNDAVGVLAGSTYRVTAPAEGASGRVGFRYALDTAVHPGRSYSVILDVSHAPELTATRKRLTVQWIVAGYGELPYGEGPYGGAYIVEQQSLPVPADGSMRRHTVTAVAPEGARGIAIEWAEDAEQVWPAGAWIQADALTIEPSAVSLISRATMDPVPRVSIVLQGLDERAEAVTVYAVEQGGLRPVRGAWRVPAASVLVLDDFLAPFGEPITYTVELLSSTGAKVGALTATSDPVDFEGTVVQNIVDPWASALARLLVGSDSDLRWQFDGTLLRPGRSRYPTWVGSGRWPLRDVPLQLATDTAEQERAMRNVFGLDSAEERLPIVALRTSHRVRWPQPFQAVVPEVQPVGLDWLAGGFLTHWSLSASEVQPPAVGVVRPAVSWEDVRALYPTWNDARDVYGTWADLMSDTSLGGASNA